ncbi:hypothetical protein SAMN06265338_10545 [Rhodoblastus acidophilus]|uniref:Uncharacterized protein n=1 Tax=Rhodoblastus acidophilus TaxID=1074 RepID=A0A212RKI9_RHOAC|nr:hypothetical protein [Rhodoblastus acidophilus]PPQ35987.1 hypothetical protein CKO16_19100 [Rhodoblastus acidophilus]RAI18318.1 hypothetical protein CH337_14525 [Rhodoblastus acidophilus]SNB72988.1 hypothetical protein SAMN06265338_10545 [Rhodoblastus acidophilus]
MLLRLGLLLSSGFLISWLWNAADAQFSGSILSRIQGPAVVAQAYYPPQPSAPVYSPPVATPPAVSPPPPPQINQPTWETPTYESPTYYPTRNYPTTYYR